MSHRRVAAIGVLMFVLCLLGGSAGWWVVSSRNARKARGETRGAGAAPAPAGSRDGAGRAPAGPAAPGPGIAAPAGPPASAAKTPGERLQEYAAWLDALRTEVNRRGGLGKPEARKHWDDSIAARLAELRKLRDEVLADPASLLERLARPDAQRENMAYFFLVAGGFDDPAKGGRPLLNAGDLPPALIDGLFALTRSGAPVVRSGILDFLSGFIRHPADWDERFLALLDDPDPLIRLAALRPLESRKEGIPEKYLPSLIDLAKTGDAESQESGIRAVAQVGSAEAQAWLLDRLTTETDPELFAPLADGVERLASSGDPADRAKLAAALRAAVPHAIAAGACEPVAELALRLPAEESREFVVALARGCTDEELRGRLDRVLAALEAGERRPEEMRRILREGK